MKRIEEFSKLMNEIHCNPALLYILWMGLLQKGSDVSLRLATRLARECPGIYFV